MKTTQELEVLLTKDYLKEKYLTQNLLGKQIAAEIGCNPTTIHKYLRKFNIVKISYPKLTKEYLIANYIDKDLTEAQIAEQIGCHRTIIGDWLQKFGIKKIQFPILTKEFLIENYLIKKLTCKQIAKLINSNTVNVVTNSLKKYNLPIRSYSEAFKGRVLSDSWRKRISQANLGKKFSLETKELMRNKNIFKGKKGVHSFNWKGGITPLANRIRSSIKGKIWIFEVFKKDNYHCQICNAKSCYFEAHHVKEFHIIFQEFLNQYPQLNIEKDKEELVLLAENYAPFWDIANGKTVCLKCHNKLHGIKEDN